jgi:hypothetical protein
VVSGQGMDTNSRSRGRPPKPLQGRGEIRSDCLYPLTVLLRRLGISRNSLTAMRRRGLPVRFISRRSAVVDGGELIAFLRKEWREEGSENG